jgi:hypothetical protein
LVLIQFIINPLVVKDTQNYVLLSLYPSLAGGRIDSFASFWTMLGLVRLENLLKLV